MDIYLTAYTVLTIVSPTGEKTEYEVHIERDTYEVKMK